MYVVVDWVEGNVGNLSFGDCCLSFWNRVIRNNHFGTTFSRFQISFLDQGAELINVKLLNPLFYYWRRIESKFRQSKIKTKSVGAISSFLYPKRRPMP